MTTIARTTAAVLVMLGCFLFGGTGAAAAESTLHDVNALTSQAMSGATVRSAGPLGSDSRESVITAAVVGLGLGGVIAFWQSRRHRRKDSPPDEPNDAL